MTGNLLSTGHLLAIVRDISDQMRAEEARRQRLAYEQAVRAEAEAQAHAAELSAIFEAITDGVLVCDARAEIRYINAAFRSMLGLEEDADPSVLQFDQRLEWLALRDSEGRPLPREQFATVRLLRGERLAGTQTTDFLCRTRKGEDLIVNVSGAPIPDASGQIVGAVIVLRDVTGRRSLERQLQYSERKLRSLVESNIFGMMVSDRTGRIYETNDCYAQMVGYSKEELLSGAVTWQRLNLPEYQEASAQATRDLFSTGVILPYEKEYLRKDGSRVPLLMAGAVIDGERGLVLVVTLDISARKAAERRKEEFLRMVSHELRTPLTVILGSLEIALLHMQVLGRSLAPETKEVITQIENLLTQASGQVEVETRLEAPMFEVSVQQENLVSIVQQTVANQQRAAPMRNIELVLPAEEQVPLLVDAGRIGQVLTNYLTNALRYAPVEQPIEVHLEVEASMARVSVRDQGPGLTPEQQQRVWERFYRVAAPGQRGPEGGLGLGLAIVKAIVEKHHGQVGVESAPGQGATFWFTVPLADERIPARV
jgi:PAS domain S-box-containing protein